MRAEDGLMRWRLLAVVGIALAISTTACSHEVVDTDPDTAPGPASPLFSSQAPAASDNLPPLSSTEAAQIAGACLLAKGWDVTVGQASITANVPEEQKDAYFRDSDECDEEMKANRPGPPDLTPALAADEYAAQQRYRACLVEHGVDALELPSYQKFEDDLLIGGIIYDLSWEAGLGQGSPLRIECDDPMNTWGNNG